MKPIVALEIGTISHGTLRPQDLLKSFSEAYAQYCSDAPNFQQSIIDDAVFHCELIRRYEAYLSDEMRENIDELVLELQIILDAFASKYGIRFGNTEGDGSDFGFWPIETD